MRAAIVRRITREGFNLSRLPLFRAGARENETVFGLLHPRGTYRLRVGPRVAALEGREHDTPTGRCSSGKWARLGKWDAPKTPGEAAVILNLAWGVIVGEGTLSPTGFEGVTGYARGDANRCRSRVDSNAPDPVMGSGCAGRGRVGRSNPTRKDGFGMDFGVRAHDPRAIYRAVMAEKRREASREYAATRGLRTDFGVYPRRTR